MAESDQDPDSSVDLSPLRGAYIVLGVTGGIAAYKAVELVRRLVDLGAYVVPVLTESAQRFVGLPTFSALGSEPAKSSLFDETDPILHTRLGQRADLIVVAPATARLIGEYAAGISRDLLGATLIATTAPVVVCPAMHTEMWQHRAVQENCITLLGRGVHIVGPESGHLAGGDNGEGRLSATDTIVRACAEVLAPRKDLAGVRVLVTAGGTREPIDPVRYIANRSSGKQGYAIAEAAQTRGAKVTLVTTAERAIKGDIEVVNVETAEELYKAVMSRSDEADVVVMAAAVADFRPVSPVLHKLKKLNGVPKISFEPTSDTLAELGRRHRFGQVVVGFAAETNDVIPEAMRKLQEKNVDLMVVNDVTVEGAGFGVDTNVVTILDREGTRADVPLAAKSTIAHAVLDAVVRRRGDHGND